jgi:hypothetical protein
MTLPFVSNGFSIARATTGALVWPDSWVITASIRKRCTGLPRRMDTAADLANAANRQRRLFCCAARRSLGGVLLAQVPGWLEGSSKP